MASAVLESYRAGEVVQGRPHVVEDFAASYVKLDWDFRIETELPDFFRALRIDLGEGLIFAGIEERTNVGVQLCNLGLCSSELADGKNKRFNVVHA